jgi:hypothetical protein
MQVLGTDAEEKENNPFVSLMGTDKVYKNLRHQLCCFHMFHMGPKGKGFLTRASCIKPEGQNIHSVIMKWLYSWADTVETKQEFEVSQELLFAYICYPDVIAALGKCFTDEIADYVRTLVLPHREKITFYISKGTQSSENRTTSSVKVKGGILKHHAVGPKPQHSINRQGLCFYPSC